MKKVKINLLWQILIAIVAGVLIGLVAPMWLARSCATFNSIFSQFLGFMIPLIIVGFVTPAIAEVGSRAGKLLVATTLLAYGATIFAGTFSYITGTLSFPWLIGGEASVATIESAKPIDPFFTITIPTPLDVMTSLVMSFMLGLGMAFIAGDTLKKGFTELREIVEKTINVAIVPLLPIYIFGIFLNMTVAGEVGTILTTFAKVIGVIFLIHIVVLIIYYCVAAAFKKDNPFRMLKLMLPAYFTALGTQSSAATIPVTLRQTIKMGVHEDVAGFVIPLCATIHLSGSALKITACALALMIMFDHPYDIGLFMHFIAMLGITMVAAPGIPGGAIMAALGVLSSVLGFDEKMLALMIALYIAMDSFGTACNVTGDGALAVILDHFFGGKKKLSRNSNAEVEISE